VLTSNSKNLGDMIVVYCLRKKNHICHTEIDREGNDCGKQMAPQGTWKSGVGDVSSRQGKHHGRQEYKAMAPAGVVPIKLAISPRSHMTTKATETPWALPFL